MGIGGAFAIIAPVFAIIGLGYAARRAGAVAPAAMTGLDFFIFNFAIPALLFRALARVELPTALPLDLWGSYFIAGAAIWLVAGAVFSLSGRSVRERVLLAFTAANPNTMLIGLPVILLALGEAALTPLLLVYTFHMIFVLTGVMLVLGANQGGATALRAALARLANPLTLSVLAGLGWAALGPPLPEAADRLLVLLGGAGIPGALFIMGASLPDYPLRGALAAAAGVSFLKLAVHPALVLVLGAFVFSLPPLDLAVATLLAAIPCGVFSFVLARQYQAAPGAISSAVALSTLLAIFTLPLVILLLPVV